MNNNLKGKVNATSLDLSTYVVSTLVSGLSADSVPVNIDTSKHNPEKPPILSLELLITDKEDNTQTPVYGEIAICDFVTQMSNSTKAVPEQALRVGQDLNFDNYV